MSEKYSEQVLELEKTWLENTWAFRNRDSEPKNVLISSSGGRTSEMMRAKMLADPIWNRHNLKSVFANTSREYPETLDFVKQCDEAYPPGRIWIEAVVNPKIGIGNTYRVVTHRTAKRNGEVFEDVIKKHGIMNQSFPSCTRDLKTVIINKCAKDIFNGQPYVTAIGMRFDEIRRVKRSESFVYPMVDWEITVDDVRSFWNQQPFDLMLKDYEGNCDGCWKKSLRKLLTIAKERPGTFDWWGRMEKTYGMLQVDGRKENKGQVFFRKNMSASDIVKMAKLPFVPVTDHWFVESKDMDTEEACSCMHSIDQADPEDDEFHQTLEAKEATP